MRRRQHAALGVLFALALSAATGGAGPAPQEQPPQLPPAKRIRVNGIELTYVEMGRGEPVVFIHGFLFDYRAWSMQIPEFSQRFRAISYSKRYRWPGLEPPQGTDLSIEADQTDLVALIRELKLGPAHLVGHSAGANLALRFAREYPEMVRSVVLGEPGPFAFVPDQADTTGEPPGTPGPPPAWIGEVREAYERGDVDAALRLLAERVVGPDRAAQPGRPWVRQVNLDNSWQLQQLWTRSAPASPLTCEEVRQIKVPVLLVGGDHSPEVFGRVLDGLEKCLPAAERATLQDSSHGLELDNPDAFNRIVLDFLSHASRRTDD